MRSLSWKRPDLSPYEGLGPEALSRSLADAHVSGFLEAKIPAISPEATVRELLFRMVTEKQLAFVVWRNRPTSVVTFLDALLAFASGMSPKTIRVADIAREENTYAVPPETPVLPLLLWMSRHGVHMVIVHEEEGLLGIFTPASALERAALSAEAASTPALA